MSADVDQLAEQLEWVGGHLAAILPHERSGRSSGGCVYWFAGSTRKLLRVGAAPAKLFSSRAAPGL